LAPSLMQEDLSNKSLYALLAHKFKLRIARGHRTIEAISADKSDAKLLELRSGSPILLLKSIGLLDTGTPLEYFIAKHRGDRSRFHVQLIREND
jgi:GntR family transcriptional regulator